MNSLIIVTKKIDKILVKRILEFTEVGDKVLLCDAGLLSTFELNNKKILAHLKNKCEIVVIDEELKIVGELNPPKIFTVSTHKNIADLIKNNKVLVWN